jgi:hypothetical protein
MRLRYNRGTDILTLELSDAPIDHADEAGPLIVYFTEDDRLIMVEILEASDFLAKLMKGAMQADAKRAVEV